MPGGKKEITFGGVMETGSSSIASSSSPWIEKYRPQTLDDIISNHNRLDVHKHAIQQLIDSVQQARSEPDHGVNTKVSVLHLLCTGAPGTGKTSLQHVLCRLAIKDPHHNVLRINASSERGIDMVRSTVGPFMTNRTLSREHDILKIVILEEADQLTTDAQEALRKHIEKASYMNVCFIFTANAPHKITEAIKSRCTHIQFQPLHPRTMVSRLRYICETENKLRVLHPERNGDHKQPVKLPSDDDDGWMVIAQAARGDMRNAIKFLYTCFMSHPEISTATAFEVTKYPTRTHLCQMVRRFFTERPQVSSRWIQAYKTQFASSFILIQCLGDFVQRLPILYSGHEVQYANMISELANAEVAISQQSCDTIQWSIVVYALRLYFTSLSPEQQTNCLSHCT